MFLARRLRLGIPTLVLGSFGRAEGQGAHPVQLDSVAVLRAVDSIFKAGLAANRFRGAALVVIDGDRILLRRGYGWSDAGHRRGVDPDSTVFNAASVSKVFVATALMQLIDEGRLQLEEPVAPRLARVRLLGPGAATVTAEHLLTHTAGLDAKFLGALAPPGTEQPGLEPYFIENPPRIVRPPGAAIAYSNIGAALAGYLVEATTGVPFYQYVEQHILEPLGMTMSSFRQPLPHSLAAHRPDPGRAGAPFFRPYPAASLVTTALDMGRFLVALLDTGRVLMSPRGRDVMFAAHWRAQPAVPGAALGFFESFGPAGRALFHTGDGGHHSLLYVIPERRFGLYAVYDTGDEQASALREELASGLVGGIFGVAAAPFPRPPAGFAARAVEYEGTYRSNSYSHYNLEKIGALPRQLSVASDGHGSLVARQFGGGGQARLTEIAPDAFRSSDGGFAAFRRDRDGRVSSIIFSGSVWDPSTADRVAWYERAEVHLATMLVAGLVFLVRLVAGGVRRLRRRRQAVPVPLAVTWRLSGILSLLFVGAPLVGPLGLFTGRPPFYSPPWSVYVSLGLLLVASGLGCLLLGLEWRGRQSNRSRSEQALVRAVGLASFTATGWLWHWNLLGIRV